MSLDLSKLSTFLSSDEPCGENLEYDSLYMELESLAIGTPGGVMGDSVIEGKEPDWRLLHKNCLELWQKTRDLRVAVHLAISSLCLYGLSGFRDGLKLVHYLTETHWDNFWPRLDPDDDNDPTERINIFSMLSPQQGSYSDPLAFISRFRDVILVSGKPYTLRDLLFVSGAEDSGSSLNPVVFEAEMSAVSNDIMQSAYDTAVEIEDILGKISSVVYEKTSGEGALNFASLLGELKFLRNFYKSHLSLLSSEELVEENSSYANDDVQSDLQSVKAVSPKFNLNTYFPANRGEALMLLRKCSEFFKKTEPTNPLPFLLERALRMADMNFIELLQDIDPGSLDRVKEQLGVPRD